VSATAMNVTWDAPSNPNGIIRHYHVMYAVCFSYILFFCRHDYSSSTNTTLHLLQLTIVILICILKQITCFKLILQLHHEYFLTLHIYVLLKWPEVLKIKIKVVIDIWRETCWSIVTYSMYGIFLCDISLETQIIQ
jgi:hypothetical protein